jgi:rhodanese-related sulfurtransferase
VARILREHGADAHVIRGGVQAWRKAGQPMEPVPAEDMLQLPMFSQH